MTHDIGTPYRVAIYAAPARDTAWWGLGSQWLGRCAARGCNMPMPRIDGMDAATQQAITTDPRRYGWHATLKAPFRLSAQTDLQALRKAVVAICHDHAEIELGDLHVDRLESFLALRPQNTPASLGALADDCVRRLQPLAAPLTEAELVRRRRAALTTEEDALMLAWGYPWVFDKFRFHFSLTQSLDGMPADLVNDLKAAATRQFADLPALRLSHLSIFIEPTPGADFILFEQMELDA
ncbi:MAG: DUF1045 domain-containing protein [Brachymonas sp.]